VGIFRGHSHPQGIRAASASRRLTLDPIGGLSFGALRAVVKKPQAREHILDVAGEQADRAGERRGSGASRARSGLLDVQVISHLPGT